jgi:hypothetical protein
MLLASTLHLSIAFEARFTLAQEVSRQVAALSICNTSGSHCRVIAFVDVWNISNILLSALNICKYISSLTYSGKHFNNLADVTHCSTRVNE